MSRNKIESPYYLPNTLTNINDVEKCVRDNFALFQAHLIIAAHYLNDDRKNVGWEEIRYTDDNIPYKTWTEPTNGIFTAGGLCALASATARDGLADRSADNLDYSLVEFYADFHNEFSQNMRYRRHVVLKIGDDISSESLGVDMTYKQVNFGSRGLLVFPWSNLGKHYRYDPLHVRYSKLGTETVVRVLDIQSSGQYSNIVNRLIWSLNPGKKIN